MENNLFMWIGIFIIAYLLFRFYSLLDRPGSAVDKEMNDILNSDKYKVKGQYD